jgi:hypothetical protein
MRQKAVFHPIGVLYNALIIKRPGWLLIRMIRVNICDHQPQGETMARPKKEVTERGETTPIFALKPPKRPSVPRHSIAIKTETMAAMDKYVTWASGALGITHDEAQAQFLEVAIPELIGKDGAYKAHLKGSSDAAKTSAE